MGFLVKNLWLCAAKTLPLQEWIEEIGLKVNIQTSKDWINGRVSIPLIAIEKLEVFGLEKEVKEIVEKIEYLCTTTRDTVKIPKTFTSNLLYLIGVILGDGCLPISHDYKHQNIKYSISVISGDKDYLEKNIQSIFQDIFETKKVSVYYDKEAWHFKKTNKPIYRFFTQLIGMPNGKKAENAKIPKAIRKMEPVQLMPFLAGLIDSDIGKHGKGLGCTFKSKVLVEDLICLLGKLGIVAKSYGTHYKNDKYIQHDFSILKSQIKKLKDVLEQHCLPKREDRLNALFSRAGVR